MIEQLHGGLITVSDTGRRIETIPIINMFGKNNVAVVRIEREGTSFKGDIREWVDLSDHGVFTCTVTNDGTELELAHKIEEHLERWNPQWRSQDNR